MEVWRKGNSACFLVMARLTMGFPSGSDGKESACNAGNLGSIPGSGRSPGKGNGNRLQYSCLENFIDREAWRATVHGVLQTRILEWGAISFSRGSFWPRDWTQVSCIAGRFFTIWAIREVPTHHIGRLSKAHSKYHALKYVNCYYSQTAKSEKNMQWPIWI